MAPGLLFDCAVAKAEIMSETSDANPSTTKTASAKSTKTKAKASASKANAAFRTISEVSDDLDIPQHVLRFWETKFTQVKPTKRAGGRRYYRPQDIELLAQIKRLLHDDGFTIKGVQKVLKSARGVSSAIEKAKEAGVEQTAETVGHASNDTGSKAEAETTAGTPDTKDTTTDTTTEAQEGSDTKTTSTQPDSVDAEAEDDAAAENQVEKQAEKQPQADPAPAVKTASVVQLPRGGQAAAAAEPIIDADDEPAAKTAPEIAVLHSALEKALDEFKTLRRDIDDLLQSLPSSS